MRGLGFSYVVTGLSDILLMTIIMKHFFNITLERRVYLLLLLELLVTLGCMWFKTFDNMYLRYSSGIIVLALSIVVSLAVLNKFLDINIKSVIVQFSKRLKK